MEASGWQLVYMAYSLFGMSWSQSRNSVTIYQDECMIRAGSISLWCMCLPWHFNHRFLVF